MQYPPANPWEPVVLHEPYPLKDSDDDVYYPCTDGEPMAESDFQRFWLNYIVMVLAHYFRNHPMVYVSGNIFLYFCKGDPTKKISPDVLVVFGVPNHFRTSYRMWDEGEQAPQFVLEVTSDATWEEDQQRKPTKYRALGVEEYFQYDPTEDYLNPPLRGRRLELGKPDEEIEGKWRGPNLYCLTSKVLGLEFHLRDGELRVYDPQEQEYLLTYDEDVLMRKQEAQARRMAEARAKRETEARVQAEAQVQELLAELARLKQQNGKP